MKKRVLSLALALALSVGLAIPALAEEGFANAGGGWTFEPVGESLDQPAPLPDHLAQRASDYWLLYDFDPSNVLEITWNEWDERIYTVLEGTEFTVWQNPSWLGAVTEMEIFTDSTGAYFYRANTPYTIEDIRYMPPVTITFDHGVTAPDGTVIDLAKLGETYTLRFECCSDDAELGIGSSSDIIIECFQVIPAVAYASTQTVDIDGEAVEFQMYALKDADGNDTNYVKVRDVALALDGTAAQFNVGWDGNVNLETGKPYTARNGQENNTPYSGDQPFTCATSATNVNGEAADLTAFVITDAGGNGSTYYKLRDLGAALGFTVDWSAERGVYIETA